MKMVTMRLAAEKEDRCTVVGHFVCGEWFTEGMISTMPSMPDLFKLKISSCSGYVLLGTEASLGSCEMGCVISSPTHCHLQVHTHNEPLFNNL